MLQLKPERYDLGEYRSQPILLCGKAFVADQSGALFWPARRTLILADPDMSDRRLHAIAGRVSSRVARTHGVLLRLAEAIDYYEPETVAVLTRGWHEAQAQGAFTARDLRILAMMQEDRRWLWIVSDKLAGRQHALGGEVAPELELEGIALRHEPRSGRGTHEIAGHMRPAACVSLYGTLLRRPCFVSNGLRLILPAFGSLAGGLNVLDDAFHALLGNRGLAVWMLGEEGLYPIAARTLRGE